MTFISRVQPKLTQNADFARQSPEDKIKTVTETIKLAKSYSSAAGQFLHILKNILKCITFVPAIIDLYKTNSTKGGSSSSIFRDNSIENNLRMVSKCLSELPLE